MCSSEHLKIDTHKSSLITFIWLDQLINTSTDKFKKIIEPYQWNFSNTISSGISLIEKQLRQNANIFLIVSGQFGEELFLTTFFLMQNIYSVYIYCAQIEPNLKWSEGHLQIKGVYDNLDKLQQRIEEDYQELQTSFSSENKQIIHYNLNQVFQL